MNLFICLLADEIRNLKFEICLNKQSFTKISNFQFLLIKNAKLLYHAHNIHCKLEYEKCQNILTNFLNNYLR